ncbi:MAG: hypothetical protein EBW16_07275, partial [Burkholderiaceae bacterium]|nr:hypothetical protein [Burkholderiaceae bacterium]
MSINDAANNTMNDIELAEDEDINTVLANDIDISGLTLDTASSFDVILNKKIAEINELYELKSNNKKMIANPNEINFMDKKLYNKINAAIDKKYKESKQYKKKCEEEVQNA